MPDIMLSITLLWQTPRGSRQSSGEDSQIHWLERNSALLLSTPVMTSQGDDFC